MRKIKVMNEMDDENDTSGKRKREMLRRLKEKEVRIGTNKRFVDWISVGSPSCGLLYCMGCVCLTCIISPVADINNVQHIPDYTISYFDCYF
mgnify:CR=1 FL=1